MYCQIAGEEAEILHSRHKAGGFPGSSVVKKKKTLLPMQETQARSQVWEDILEEEMATPSFHGKPMDRGAWQATVHSGTESDTT